MLSKKVIEIFSPSKYPTDNVKQDGTVMIVSGNPAKALMKVSKHSSDNEDSQEECNDRY